MKKIIIVSSSFYPQLSPRSFRTTELVKEFCRQGHEVTLVTHYFPDKHDGLMEDFGFKIKDLGKMPVDFKIKGKGIIKLARKIIRRALLLFFEYPMITLMSKVKKVLSKESGYDLLISVAVPHPIHWGVAWARTEQHRIAKTWIADCGDPYMGSTLDSFKKMFYFKYLEKWFCRKADSISIPRLAMTINFYPEFHDKFIEIPQGFKFEDSQKHLKPYTPNEVPTFVFSGLFILGSRDPRPLFDLLLESKKDFKFHIFTRSKHIVEPYLEKSQGKIILHDYIPREDLLAFLSQMDFLVNIAYDPKTQLPSKLIDYYLTGRPILNIDSNYSDKENIIRFLNGDYSGKFVHPNIDQYRIENVSKKFLEASLSLKEEIEQH